MDSLLGMLTIRLQDDNFVKWSFQFTEESKSTLTFSGSTMYCQGESSNTTHNSPESSQYFNGGFGFVSGSNTNSQARGSRPTGGFVSQANLPQFQGNGTFQHQRNYHNNGANNGRFNNRPRFNNGSSGRFSENSNYFSGSSSNNGGSNFGPKGGSTWQNWNGNNGSKSALIPECQICNKKGHTAPKLLLLI